MSNLINTNATAMVNECSLEDVKKIKLPKKTKTYQPVSHASVIKYASTQIPKMLSKDWKLEKVTFGMSNKGQYLFGMVTFTNGDGYMGPSIAFRNSYNKEFALGFAFGAQVFVCANGMFTGDVVVAKKHTPNVWASVKELMKVEIGRVEKAYHELQESVRLMREIEMNDAFAWSLLGKLRGKDILTPRVFETALKEWATPSHDEHKDGTALQLYNACTEALKMETLPSRAMSQRIALHGFFQREVFPVKMFQA